MRNKWGSSGWKDERATRDAAIYAEIDARTPEREMTMQDSQRMLCRSCGYYASILIGGYAFTREDPWKLYGCRCKYKYVWVYTIKSPENT